jgi:hypothetical protein
MGMPIRDDRQMKALTGLSHAQCDPLLPVFNDLYQASSTKRMQQGSHLEPAHANRAVVPKANGPRWQRNGCSSSRITQRIQPVRGWGPSVRGGGRKRINPCLHDRRSSTTRAYLAR